MFHQRKVETMISAIEIRRDFLSSSFVLEIIRFLPAISPAALSDFSMKFDD
jgi:hypothetical protein